MGAAEKMITHKGKDYLAHIYPIKYTIKVKPIANNINCETTRKILGYRDLIKMDALLWKNSMCNELGRLSQGSKKYARTETIQFIFHKYKPKDIKATYVRAVCDIRPQKTETPRTRITAGGNIIEYTGAISIPTTYLTTLKLHINSSISDVNARYICMDVKSFYLNNKMDRSEYIMIQIATIPQEFVDKYNLQ